MASAVGKCFDSAYILYELNFTVFVTLVFLFAVDECHHLFSVFDHESLPQTLSVSIILHTAKNQTQEGIPLLRFKRSLNFYAYMLLKSLLSYILR